MELRGGIPGYWMNETSGALRPAVVAYLLGAPITEAHIVAMRAYLRQWVAAPGFIGADVEALRATLVEIRDRRSLKAWLGRALDAGIDPL